MNILLNDFLRYLSMFLLVMTRISAWVVACPFIGSKIVSGKIKIIVILTLSSLVMVLLLPNYCDYVALPNVGMLIMQQILVGLSMGFVFQCVVQTFMLCGEIIAMQSGLGMALMNDPSSGASYPVINQVFLLMCTLLFFIFDAPLALIKLLLDSFKEIPLNGSMFAKDFFWQIANLGRYIYVEGFKYALPMVTFLLIIQFSFGIITKVAPQLNIFTLGFPLILMLSLLFLWLNLSGVKDLFFSSFDTMLALVSDSMRA